MRLAEAGVVLLCTGLAYGSRAAFGPPQNLSTTQLGAVGLAAIVLLPALWFMPPTADTFENLLKTAFAVVTAAIITFALSFLGWVYLHSRMTLFFFFAYSFFGVSMVRTAVLIKSGVLNRSTQHRRR